MSLWATAMAFQRPDTFCLEESGLSQNNTSSAPCPGKNQTCWEGYTEQPLTYILSIPMTIVLAVRLEFLKWNMGEIFSSKFHLLCV